MLCVKFRIATPGPPLKRMSPTVTRVPPPTGSRIQNGNRAQTRNARMFGAFDAAATRGSESFFGTSPVSNRMLRGCQPAARDGEAEAIAEQSNHHRPGDRYETGTFA